MGDKYRLTPQFEADLIARNPDAPMCSVTSIAVHIGKSEAWVIRHWENGDMHAYEWAVNPYDPADVGRRGKKICLQTHPDSAMACKQTVDAQTAAHWQENAARLNAPRTVTTSSSGSVMTTGVSSPSIPWERVADTSPGSAMTSGVGQKGGPGIKTDPNSGSVK